MNRLLAVGLLLFGATLSGCESAAMKSGASTPSPTPDLPALAAQYAAIAAQGNTAMAEIEIEFKSDSTVAQYNATAKKAAAVYHDVDGQLARLHFPDSMANDVKRLLSADSIIAAIYISVSTDTTIAAVSADADRLTKAYGDKSAAVGVIRKDLGLPPATAATA